MSPFFIILTPFMFFIMEALGFGLNLGMISLVGLKIGFHP